MGVVIIAFCTTIVICGFLSLGQVSDPRDSILIMLAGILTFVCGNIYLISKEKGEEDESSSQ